jgi:F0F1-type ATP synthase membrane subunit b/b'
MAKFITGFILGLLIGLIGISAIMYYAKGDWIEFKIIVLDIADLIYKIIYAYFKYIIGLISLIVGAVLAYLIYEFVDINNYKKSKEAEIEEKYQRAKKEIKEAENKAIRFLEEKRQEAERIMEQAREEAERIRNEAFKIGYEQGKEKFKEDFKLLKKRMTAVKSIFKHRQELNQCFKKITGWSFEKWLKER